MKRKLFTRVVLSILLCISLTTNFTYAKIWTIKVTSSSFVPSNLTHVYGGDTIRWVWVTGVHTTTSTSIPADAEPWDSPITQDDSVFMYIPTVNGTFHYQCTPHSTTMTGSFVVSGASGISPDAGMPRITLFPNPFVQNITIKAAGVSNWIKSLSIYSMKGELIRNITYKKGNSPAITVNLQDLAAGLYIVRITDNLNRPVSRRIIRK